MFKKQNNVYKKQELEANTSFESKKHLNSDQIVKAQRPFLILPNENTFYQETKRKTVHKGITWVKRPQLPSSSRDLPFLAKWKSFWLFGYAAVTFWLFFLFVLEFRSIHPFSLLVFLVITSWRMKVFFLWAFVTKVFLPGFPHSSFESLLQKSICFEIFKGLFCEQLSSFFRHHYFKKFY